MTIGAGAGLSSGAGLATAKLLEIFAGPFARGSAFSSEVSSLSATDAVFSTDLTAAFGCKVVCGLGDEVAADLGGGAIGTDAG
jgi:hypothetical protein